MSEYHTEPRWAVIERTGPTPTVVPMRDEKHARATIATWIEFAKQRAPEDKDKWPQLLKGEISWEVVE